MKSKTWFLDDIFFELKQELDLSSKYWEYLILVNTDLNGNNFAEFEGELDSSICFEL